ncbi:MAG: acetyl-CoA decarbonylase/synthase complex subunit gamma [Candidatus Fraserbacteria bacterium RBG_16_55_9]|uniref:Acetyl-CoA decarbonylase/synthase complex subunit gamma n=1 Tax=Fraserbacteria sp. (strain RBG_16_55_9) TaxID=1817864 RepID=A0A1F5UTI2_FRAXR|nr:MAG: acetyl-CoA decarbonylase/synthase complex subunit gamma [Candidatus Fraserbacteria bacterium RBG_16_55_9]
MAKLTGIEIYKQLPKTNCGDCNFPTCMAFAMQVAAKKVGLEQCPHVSAAGKAALSEAQAPPMRTVTIGAGDRAIKVGGETVLFRHDEKFHHQTVIAIRVRDDLSESDFTQRLEKINQLQFVRVGQKIAVNAIAIEQTNSGKFTAAVTLAKEKSSLALILISPDPHALKAALEVCADRRPLLYAATSENLNELAALAKQFNCPLTVQGKTLEELAELTQQIKALGVEELVLNPQIQGMAEGLTKLTLIRRLALEKLFRPLGYPVMIAVHAHDPFEEAAQASACICKYASLVVMEGLESWQLLPILTARQNIYTDPQVPNAVEAKLYKVGEPGPQSPVLVTTNFALTYFTVEGEVENSRVPAYIAVVDTGGLGVLNAYADDKLTAEGIVKAVKSYAIMDQVAHKKLVIPGLVAVLKGEIEDEGGWEVLVGPEEAAGLPAYLRNDWKG